MKIKDIKGIKFGRLTAMSPIKRRYNRRTIWRCSCDCGKICLIKSADLIKGGTKSCGCLKKEMFDVGIHTKHSMSKTPLYKIWSAIKTRCLNKKSWAYGWYGGRGITISNNWMDFINFYRDMKDKYRMGLQIDRIDSNGNYCKDNCRWVTSKENNNNRRNTIMLTYKGRKKTLTQWCDELQLSPGKIRGRLRLGWDIEKIFNKK